MGNIWQRAGRLAVAAGVGAALALAPAGPAAAADTPIVIAAFTYVSPVVVSLATGTVSVTNLDGVVAAHNIVSQDVNPATGAPWFRSPLTTSTAAQNVEGVAETPPGLYMFTCDLHSFMTGALLIV